MKSANTFSRRTLLGAATALACHSSMRCLAQDSQAETTAPSRLTYESPKASRWKIGLILDTPVTCVNVQATFPVPVNWPEQEVTVRSQNIDPRVSKWAVRSIAGGAKQVVLQIPQVVAGTTAEVTFELDIERSRIMPPAKTDDLVIPKKLDRDLMMFMGKSPQIDLTARGILAASKEVAEKEAQSDWERVELIYDYVREKVQYVEGDLKNASDALKDGTGDCEEMTSLFVAMCRNAKVPARMVWIPGHCYPEFYLEDPEGNGHWFPCQAAGTRQFGRMDEYRPVLQKGDRFKVPEKRETVRYVAEFFKCDRRGSGTPRPNFVREQLDV
ncbi:transglutaminase-like domain-containing protein [Stieleria varia]|uniref:Transglutaminase-like superfamily protein n=1 Tax=Stieleria varia TaxID=2528005 RepID=A0A5C6AWT3_9BACT|nr:transglutaminase-like domain-containing protein [Stieleria varia]TWU02574.1 Transglutaminase-like superfamily protein [Stieleria varia]